MERIEVNRDPAVPSADLPDIDPVEVSALAARFNDGFVHRRKRHIRQQRDGHCEQNRQQPALDQGYRGLEKSAGRICTVYRHEAAFSYTASAL
jgi:hypothetical protein